MGGEPGLVALAVAFCLGLFLSTGAARADDYCCPCKNKPQSIEADDKASATAQCSLLCKRFVLAKSGRCEGDVPAAAAPAQAALAAGGASAVSLFKTEDCSGDAATITASTARLPEGYRSFQGESGEPVQAWEKPDFAGAATQPVGAGICLSPGWDILGVKFGK